MKHLTEEKQSIWYKCLTDLGHSPKMNSYGHLDYFAFDVMGHNGPSCTKCGKSWCWHCTDPEELLHCTNTQMEMNFDV
jgi:hypothetical protein